MVWVPTPRRCSSAVILWAVVVFPDPEGPERSTTGLSFIFLQIRSAACSTFFWYWWSHSSINPNLSARTAWLIFSS